MASGRLGGPLQPLADALAEAFAQGETSAACARVLRRLLGPDLRFVSIVVRNSSMQLVAAANYADPGPATLHVLDAGASAAGLALARRQPLLLQLQNGSTSAGMATLGDVQVLLAAAPDAQQAICVPFNGGPAAGGNAQRCECCSTPGSSSGGLLVGLAASIDARRLVLLTRLAECLPQPVAQRSADTLSFVSFACGDGTGGGFPCCCYDTNSEGEEEPAAAAAAPCLQGPAGRGSDDSDGPSPAPLRLSAECARGGGSSRDAAGPSRVPEPEPPASGPLSPVSSSSSAHAGPFSKLLVAAAAAETRGAGLAQCTWTLRFSSDLAEREYCRWMSPALLVTDSIAAVLILVAMAIVAFAQSFRLVEKAPAILLQSAGMALPLLFVLYARSAGARAYQTWRNRFLATFRLYALAFAAAAIPAYQSLLPEQRRCRLDALWRLSGAEALFATAVGFVVPQKLHIPLHLAGLAIALAQLPRTCEQACAGAAAAGPPSAVAWCLWQGAAMASLLGCLLPTACLRVAEQYSRRSFARLVLAEAVAD